MSHHAMSHHAMSHRRAVTAAMSLAGQIDRLERPADVLDALHRHVATIAEVSVFGAWRSSLRQDDLDSYIVGKNVFLHPTVPRTFIDDFFAMRREHGPSVTVRRAWQNRGPFTLTEAMREAKASGRDRWVFDLFAHYGIRDGFYCPHGMWIVLFWSKRILKLPVPTRAMLSFAAELAAFRLEDLMERNRKQFAGKREPALTARELAVLYQVSVGERADEIARALQIAEATVRTFLKRAQKKLNARTPAHAVAEAMRGLLMQ
jgi:DNA-binding CsgD family transcriptional regulator